MLPQINSYFYYPHEHNENICDLNGQNGIFLFVLNNNMVINNTCTNNNKGITLEETFLNSMGNNILLKNINGISVIKADNNNITYNLIAASSHLGTSVDGYCDNNNIHHNFYVNNYRKPQAEDDGTNNLWYNDSLNEGNYWSDYSGTGLVTLQLMELQLQQIFIR